MFKDEHVHLSERDSLRVLEMLKKPPVAPNSLVRVAKAHFTTR
jgi:uncharacterized protein (DUF1778 family)